MDSLENTESGGRDTSSQPSTGSSRSALDVKVNEFKKKKIKHVDKSSTSKKKPPMKTALDVINRIKWDSALKSSHFTVGYLDRFSGITEKDFVDFDWESNIADVGPEVLAIPQHRISYFKLNGEIVWEKENRIDNVFGSTGSLVKLQVVMDKQIEKEVSSVLDSLLEEVCAVVNSSKPAQLQQKKLNEHMDDVKEALKSVIDKVSMKLDDVQVKDTPNTNKSRKQARPNYFVGVKVDGEMVRKCVSKYYQRIESQLKTVGSKDLLQRACTSLSKLHITFCVCHLETEEEIAKVKQVTESVFEGTAAIHVEFKRVSNFDSRVFYAVPQTRELHKPANELQQRLRDSNINMDGNYSPYKPHLTLLRLHNHEANNNLKQILANKKLKNWSFHRQHLAKVVICKIGSWNQEGFYEAIAEYNLKIKPTFKKGLPNAPTLERQRSFESQDIRIGKTLTAVLRHNKFGFKVNSEGYLALQCILNHKRFAEDFKVTREDVLRIVESNDKKRFEIKKDENGIEWIKATQGHTVKVKNLELKEITDPTDFPVVVHGTFFSVWEKIKLKGLNRMKRVHIHMTTAEPNESKDVISGMKKGCNVFIHINLSLAMEEGLKFFLSSNGVILSPGDDNGFIRPKYFQSVFRLYGRERICIFDNAPGKRC